MLRLLRAEALDIYKHAVDSVKVDKLIRDAVKEIDLQLYSPHVIGGGKSVLAMAQELADIVVKAEAGHLFSHGLISLPGGLRNSSPNTHNILDSIKVERFFGSENNVPNEDSVSASELMLEEVDKACQQDKLNGRIPLFIVLLSGGGSSCLTSPKYISLDEKLALISFLVQHGADIVELNKVRRFFSNIKGGKLAKRILTSEPRSKIITLILSDVIGDPVEFIASGPTYIDHSGTHYESMQQILNKYGYKINLDKVNKVEPDDVTVSSDNISNYVIGNNSIAISAAIKRAKELNYQVTSLGNCLQGSTESILNEIWCSRCTASNDPCEKNSNKTLVIGGGEATVSKLDCETWGKGGRVQEMALDFLAKSLRENDHSDTVSLFLAGSTDGQDGPTDVAGCCASLSDVPNDHPYGLDEIMSSKKSHDSFNFWSKYQPDNLIRTGLTGTNVMDLYMLLSTSVKHLN